MFPAGKKSFDRHYSSMCYTLGERPAGKIKCNSRCSPQEKNPLTVITVLCITVLCATLWVNAPAGKKKKNNYLSVFCPAAKNYLSVYLLC
jgi:hypothetical protein